VTPEQKKSLAAKDPRYARLFSITTDGTPAAPAKPNWKPCLYLGERIPGQPCGSQLTRCNLYGDITTTVTPCSVAQRCCSTCDKKQTVEPLPYLTPTWTHQFADDLLPDRHVTNCSILPYKSRLLLAYRTGWMGARIHVAELHDGLKAGPSKTLNLSHPYSVGGREDPRLFIHNDRLHLAYVGVRLLTNRKVIARQLFARLTDDYEVEYVWEPFYDASPEWEKNWQPFSVDGRLFAVYSMQPWRVLELMGGRAVQLFADGPNVPWSGGFARGGAPPVLHNGEFYAFFHGSDFSRRGTGQPDVYTVGVCTFEAKPPFRPLRITTQPIFGPDMTDLPRFANGRLWHAATAFPCGAYHDAGQWVVSYGHNDHWCRVSAFNAEEIESRLCKI